MILIIILSVLWIVFASIDGFVQAHYYDLFPSEKKHRNLHPYFVIQRLIVLGLMAYEMQFNFSVWETIIFTFALIFIFSFFHNGFYYLTRNKLNPAIYKKKFFDDSDTSKAVFELGFGYRTAMAVIGSLFITGIILSI